MAPDGRRLLSLPGGAAASIGWTLVRLARLDPVGGERTGRWQEARRAWASIGRTDLIESVRAEFE
ncbi:MAG TPA: hypothetical protein VFB06_11880 [Streptosporangiaceae bacterium]|nr:hypothetical protein [Streptosporangiaceae bacterium]